MNQALILYNLPMLFPFIRYDPKYEYGNAALVCAVQQGGKIVIFSSQEMYTLSPATVHHLST